MSYYSKAMTLEAVDNAVRFTEPVTPGHPFFTEFSQVRGNFNERVIYRALNINTRNYKFNEQVNAANKSLVFLAGMRGSGKTTELNKIIAKINHPDAFFAVMCQLDDTANGLDINDLEYMDILVFQLERLVAALDERKILIKDSIIGDLQEWYVEKIKEVNTSINREGGFEIEVGAKTPSLLSFLNISAALKGSLKGSKENATKIRSVLKQNFTAFSNRFNLFVERVNTQLRKDKQAKEILFIVDGLEKVATSDMRRKIVDDESNRIRQIKVNTIFTLPIDLFSLEPKLRHFSTIINFPFVKIVEKNGARVPNAIAAFREFTLKRIDASLFESEKVIEDAICYGGGSPRELLRVLEYAYLHSDDDATQLTMGALELGIKRLSAEYSRRLTSEELDQLRVLKERNEAGLPTTYDEAWQKMMEDITIMEYNEGTYKRVNPIVEVSEIYRAYVGG